MTVRDVFTAAARQKMDDMEMTEGIVCGEEGSDLSSLDELEQGVELAVDAGWFE